MEKNLDSIFLLLHFSKGKKQIWDSSYLYLQPSFLIRSCFPQMGILQWGIVDAAMPTQIHPCKTKHSFLQLLGLLATKGSQLRPFPGESCPQSWGAALPKTMPSPEQPASGAIWCRFTKTQPPCLHLGQLRRVPQGVSWAFVVTAA